MLFKIYNKKELKEKFTHYGTLFGIPVYININDEVPEITTRNFIPQFVLDVAEEIYFFIEGLHCANDPDYEPVYAIRLIKPIK